MEKNDQLPTRQQCKNYKRKHVFDNFFNFASVNEVMLPHLVNDKETFESITDLDKLIYLGGYNYEVEEETNSKYDFGFVLTTKRLLLNAYKALLANPGGLNAAFDGTFQICHNNWVLGNNGFLSSKYRTKDRKYGQTYNLSTICLMRNETIRGFYEWCKIFGEAFYKFFELTLLMNTFGADHSTPIFSGVMNYFAGALGLSCWPHLIRKQKENKGKLCDKNNWGAIIKDIYLLHLASSQQMFDCMCIVMIREWTNVLHEDCFAEYFDREYLTSPWNNWFASSSGIPGVLPNQNPQESSHRLFKQCQSSGSLHNSTEFCINNTIPEILANARFCEIMNILQTKALYHQKH